MKTALQIILLTFLAGVSFAQDAKKPDYKMERFALAAEEDFKPYALQAIEKALIQQAMKAWQDREQAKAFETLNKLLAIYPYSIEAHRRLADGCEVILESVQDAEQKKFFQDLEAKHRSAYKGIVDSITSKRDGKTEKSAYEVITISEEYWIMTELGLTPTRRDSDIAKGFDVFTAKDSDEKERKVYFDVSRLLNAKGDQEKGTTESKPKTGGEQAGADQPATASEPKPEGKDKPKPESKVHPQ